MCDSGANMCDSEATVKRQWSDSGATKERICATGERRRSDSGASMERQWSEYGATVERQWSDEGANMCDGRATVEILVATYSRQWSGYTRMKKIIRV